MSASDVRSFARAMLATDDSKTATFQRLMLSGVIFAHGLQKALGWFGGWGIEGTLNWFDTALGVPAPLASLVILSDSVGSIALALGLCSRFAALGTTLTMTGAILLFHAPNGFFMNWSGTQAGEGFEFHLLALALSVPIVIRGGGAHSLDRWLTARLGERRAAALATAKVQPGW